MGRWTDLAQWKGPTRSEGDGDGITGEAADLLAEHRGVVLHIAQGTYDGTIAWQRNPSARVSSHFVVAKDGRAGQVVDTSIRAWTQRDGNDSWLSVENEGYVPAPLTAAQVVTNARLLARAHQVHGVPLQLATSPAGRGLGHHSMGAESGADWGHSECPGPAIKAQKLEIIRLAIEIIGDDDMPSAQEIVDAMLAREITAQDGTKASLSVFIANGFMRTVSAQYGVIEANKALVALANAVARIDGVDAAELQAAVATLQKSIGQVDESVLAALGHAQDPAAVAALLRAALGDRADAVFRAGLAG